ncbi:DUF1704 domain-containing protein [Patescibacteria group bacterium]|nr:DUF1704 domain-containing protein [Patescibacteria group bacterium]
MRAYKDKILAQFLDELPVVSLKTLLKPQTNELRALRNALESETGALPLLSFPRVNSFQVADAKQAAHAIHQKIASSPAHPILVRFYLEKLSEYELKIDLIEAVQKDDSLAIGRLTQKIHGPVTITTNKYEELITKRLQDHKAITPKKKSKTVNAETFAKLARQKLDAIGGQDWAIKVMKRDRIQIAYKRAGSATLRIPADLELTKKRAEQILRHEIDGHAKRTINGLQSGYKILGRGLAYYKRTEEGVATHIQKTVNSGLWDGYAASLRKEQDLQEAYNALVEKKMRYYQSLKKTDAKDLAKASAWRLIKRTLRGVHDPSQAGAAFFRTHIYFEGKEEVRKAIKKNPLIMNDLMIGNIGLQHVHEVKELLATK